MQDPLKPQFGGLTPNRVKTQTIRLPSKTAADPKAAAKPTANASVGGFSLTPSIKLPSVGSFAPLPYAKPKEAEPKPVHTQTMDVGDFARAIPGVRIRPPSGCNKDNALTVLFGVSC
jgi:hypothetical protein